MSSRGASFTRACCLLVSSVLVVIWPRGQCVLTIYNFCEIACKDPPTCLEALLIPDLQLRSSSQLNSDRSAKRCGNENVAVRYVDVIVNTMASQITRLTIVYCLFRHRWQKISKLRVTGLCAGNSPVTGEFPAQRVTNVENVSIWWPHHETMFPKMRHYFNGSYISQPVTFRKPTIYWSV